MHKSNLLHPEFWRIAGPDGTVTEGADQDWFPTLWQQRAGCGPTAAAVTFAYLARSRPELAPLCPGDVSSRAAFTEHMCRVWEHVTPSMHGLNRPEMMRDGMVSYAKARGVPLSVSMLVIPAARTKRPSYEAVSRFIHSSLAQECPVPFLNLHHGKVKELDWWHWVTIAGLDGARALILDSGKALEIDLALWLETTRRRGGFVSAAVP